MKDYQAEWDRDHGVLADAEAGGFLNARDIRDGLGYSKPGPTGRYYDSIGTASRYIRDAGEEFIYLLPDGGMYMLGNPPVRTTIPKYLRIGVYHDTFLRVLAHKEAADAKRLHTEWRRNMDDALAARAEYGSKTDLMDWDLYIEGIGPEPTLPDEDLLNSVAQVKSDKILDALRAYKEAGLRLNKKGLPPGRKLEKHAGFYISKEDRQRYKELV